MPVTPGTKGGINVAYVAYTPLTEADVPNGAMFLDSANGNSAAVKGTGGGTTPIGAVSSGDILIKAMQNKSGASILINTPVAKLPNGGITAGDSDGTNTQVVIGITLEAIADDAIGNVALIGPNVIGCITGLGFAPGEAVYIAQVVGGYTNDLASLTDSNDSIIRIGYADCSAGTASASANDLILFSEVLARP